MGGRPRTPTSILEARGSFRNHPERRADREDEPTDLPDLGGCPDWLNDAEKAAWNDIVSWAPHGVLTQADKISVELAAVLLARARGFLEIRGEDEETGETKVFVLEPISDARFAQLVTLLGKFGMNPADRTKVKVPKKPTAANPFAKIG